MFTQVDKSWKEIMRQVHKFPNCIRSGTRPGDHGALSHTSSFDHTCSEEIQFIGMCIYVHSLTNIRLSSCM